MGKFFSRFTSFEKLIAPSLIKVFYWIGVAGIGLMTLVMLVGALGAFTQSFAAGLGGLVATPIISLVSLIFWRFICEAYMVFFGMYDRLGNIQEAVGGGKAKDINTVSD